MKLFIRLTVCLTSFRLLAGIVLNEEHDTIHITDYPPEVPCTLSRVMAVDKAFGWWRIKYDGARNVYTITGNLMIGANDGTSPTIKHGSDTVLQIGSISKPHETLVMHGNLYVMPYWVKGENPGTYWGTPRKMNALVLGNKTNDTCRGILKFACSAQDKYTLYCGRMPWITPAQFGGGVYVYNSEISALHPDPESRIGDIRRGNLHLYGSVVLENARVADIQGGLYGMQKGVARDYLVRDSVFENIGAVLVNGHHAVSRCRFLNCRTAVLDEGGLRAELSDCVFRGNACNWSLGYNGKLTLIDCDWEVPVKGDVYRVWVNRKGIKQYPKLTVRRHVVVVVMDKTGKPVPDATLVWQLEQEEADEMQVQLIKTGKDGRTPGRNTDDALVLTDYVKIATDALNQPEIKSYSYTLTAEKDGKHANLSGVRPEEAWKLITMTIE